MRAAGWVVWIFAGALAACGGDYCSSAQSYEQNAVGRQGSCAGTITSTNFAHSACEQALGSCSPGDQSQINGSIDCLNGLPACTPSTEGSFVGSEIDCANRASSVSLACIGALVGAGVPIFVTGFHFATCGSSGKACNHGNDCCSGTCTNNACV